MSKVLLLLAAIALAWLTMGYWAPQAKIAADSLDQETSDQAPRALEDYSNN